MYYEQLIYYRVYDAMGAYGCLCVSMCSYGRLCQSLVFLGVLFLLGLVGGCIVGGVCNLFLSLAGSANHHVSTCCLMYSGIVVYPGLTAICYHQSYQYKDYNKE